jgi:hypothetical protein
MFIALAALMAGSVHADSSWVTPAEAAHFATTPSYADTLAYLQRLQQAAPGKIHMETFGTTPEGRPMTVVIASGDGNFTPEKARASHKPVVLVQAGIHSGEIEGKDAGLMLLRDFAIAGKFPHLLDHVVLVYIPVFNVDGHEDSSPYHRMSQNGPASRGYRGNGQYLNINRDYVKADTPEMHAWLKLWRQWSPDFFVDVHTTDGADYQYDLTWYTEDEDKLDPAVAAWQHDAIVDEAMPAYDKRGHLGSVYLNLKDGTDPRKGLVNFGSGPRFSTGYVALRNRPALLIETHMLKPYKVRVQGSYDLVELLLMQINQHPEALLAANAKADADAAARLRTHSPVPMNFKLSGVSTQHEFKGYEFTRGLSDISNAMTIQYHPDKPKTYIIPDWNDLQPDRSVTPPAAYAIPVQWTTLIDKLDAHGIAYQRIGKAQTIHAQAYQLDDPQWADKPFEGHLMLKTFKQSTVSRDVLLPSGSVIVPLTPGTARVAMELLEPQAPDSLVHWGYLDMVFEAKEGAHPRDVEKMAQQMTVDDPALKAAFEQKLHDDPAFAANARARLNFFYQRTPWYGAQHVGEYPVLRLDGATLGSVLTPSSH